MNMTEYREAGIADLIGYLAFRLLVMSAVAIGLVLGCTLAMRAVNAVGKAKVERSLAALRLPAAAMAAPAAER